MVPFPKSCQEKSTREISNRVRDGRGDSLTFRDVVSLEEKKKERQEERRRSHRDKGKSQKSSFTFQEATKKRSKRDGRIWRREKLPKGEENY